MYRLEAGVDGFIFLYGFQICNWIVPMFSRRDNMISQKSLILLRPLYTGAYLPESHELPNTAKNADAYSVIGPISGNSRVSCHL